MPDEADELILKMQHLSAQAHEELKGRSQEASASGLKSKAETLAHEARAEVEAAEKDEQEGLAKQQKAREPGTAPLEAADLLVAGREQAHAAHVRAVKGRARLNFALDQMDEAERREWEAMQAAARAETHAKLADDPTFSKP